MNRRDCCACTDRYPLSHGRHTLPDGRTMQCDGGPAPELPPGVVWLRPPGLHVERPDKEE
jgi:hypothetical protein